MEYFSSSEQQHLCCFLFSVIYGSIIFSKFFYYNVRVIRRKINRGKRFQKHKKQYTTGTHHYRALEIQTTYKKWYLVTNTNR